MKRKRLGKAQRKRVFGMFGGRCAYCGCEISLDKFSIDHIVSLYNGGKDEVENMMPSCNSCNHYKGTMGLEKFRKYLEGITRRLDRDSVTYRIAKRYGLVFEREVPLKFYFETAISQHGACIGKN